MAPLTMAEFRLDPLRSDWVLVAPHVPAPERPTAPCSFCAARWLGPQLVRESPLGRAGDGSQGWLGPTLLQRGADPTGDWLLLSADHRRGWADLSDDEVATSMTALRHHVADLSRDSRLRCAVVAIGGDGERLEVEHRHLTVTGLPLLPHWLRDEAGAFERFAGNCLLCAVRGEEEIEEHRLVHADDRVAVVCPFWSRSPYEMLVIPTHGPHLHTTDDSGLRHAGAAIRGALRALTERSGGVKPGAVIHSAPFGADGFHWHAHVLADPTHVGSLGVEVNPVPPEQAAADLRADFSVRERPRVASA